jgi:cytochrome c oxidase subunit 3
MDKALEAKQIQGKSAVSAIGMTVLLISFAMLFATLLLGYIVFRLTTDTWPPMGLARIPLTLPTISTLVIGASSVFFMNFEKAFMKNNKVLMRVNFALTLALGLGFMLIQFKLWNSMKEMGLFVSGGAYPSLFYSLTWIHAAHIVMALVSLLFLVPRLVKGYDSNRITWVQNVGKFWHFLGLVWLVMYIVMFVY